MLRLADHLPPHLLERTRVVSEGLPSSRPELVVYWMQTAVRFDENPALDVARHLAWQLGLPLLIYHGLSERYRFASDRHHTFILQAAQQLQALRRSSGLSYVFHLERPDERVPCLRQLGLRAVIIAEDMPTDPSRIFLRALASQASLPILAVDTACIVPMQVVGRAFTRAYEFRNHTQREYRKRLSLDWPTDSIVASSWDLSKLPFREINLSSQAIADWVADCDIDHTVAPIPDTIGGGLAGYERWNAFCGSGLKHYARLRNQPLIDGVSRMSAYLHYGMVSPMRLAREAAAVPGEGAEKFLDELLIWRELAYSFCFYRPDHHRWSALPEWAQATLQRHAQDPRPRVYTWEELARSQTSDELWNAAQRSLFLHGELHNNVRMTWGKALLQWASCPKEAFRIMEDLNHRYALDGRDPSSYGGMLWCLGQFDRPFQPEQPILGTVRPRPTAEHAQRLDVAKYGDKISHSRQARLPRVAVIGAGMAGAIAARSLSDFGLPVTIYEKSRGVGGRMATRRSEFGEFDHGAQYFTARHPDFRRYLESWIARGIAEPWEGSIVHYDHPGDPQPASAIPRYVGVPTMTSLARHLTSGLELQLETTIAQIQPRQDRFELLDADRQVLADVDRVVLSLPAPQTANLLQHDLLLARRLEAFSMQPCWCLMVALPEDLPVGWDGAFINRGPIRWLARNGTKPGRPASPECLVVHASPEWSNHHLESEKPQIASLLLDALWEVLQLPRQSPLAVDVHRWRYSIATTPAHQRAFGNAGWTLVACGDWAGGSKVEGAFLSGCAAAGRILGSLAPLNPPSRQRSLF
jgi:photolyase PhrII